MIRGFFSPTHLGKDDPAPTQVPLLDAFLYLPSIDQHVTLQFLVDTGADVSVLHPQDGLRLASREEDWEAIRSFPREYLGGAGAGEPYFGVPAFLFLTHDDDETWVREIRIWMADADSRLEHESLLGRDVLEHFKMTFVQSSELTLEALT